MSLPINKELQGGKYRIVRFINSGGFGCTYEAEHTLFNKRFAIKEFFMKDFCNRDENTFEVSVGTHSKKELVEKLKKKFINEAKMLFEMRHPGIVEVIDIFEENGTAYYVMEYIDGISLHEVIKERGPLPEAEAIHYISQMCDALRYVHEQNRLHLDIKPGNIMLNKAGKVVLIDFGAAKHYDAESGENTSTLMGVNTPGYASPEQTTQSFTTFNPSTDIYSVGATLYKLLTGVTPPDSVGIMTRMKTLAPLPDNISASTRHAVEQAMQSIRTDRPQSIDEFLQLLNIADSDKPANDTITAQIAPDERTELEHKPLDNNNNVQEEEVEAVVTPKPKSSAKRKILWGTALALVAAAIAGGFFFLKKDTVKLTPEFCEAIQDQDYTYIQSFSEGLAVVRNENDQWGFINTKGLEIIPCKYKGVYPFRQGLATVANEDGEWGFINKKGEEVIPCKYKRVMSFSDGLAPVANEDREWGFINKEGEIVIPYKYKRVMSFFDGLAPVENEEGQWGFINKEGEEVIPCKYNDAMLFFEGLAAVENEESQWGFINKKGEMVIPYKYEYADFFSDGLALVANEDRKWEFINKKGEEVISCKYKGAIPFSDGLAPVINEDRKYGFINKEGEEVIPCKYGRIRFSEDLNNPFKIFFEGLAAVANEEGKWGFINKEGEKIIPFIYDDADQFSHGVAAVELNGKWGYVDAKGNDTFTGKDRREAKEADRKRKEEAEKAAVEEVK